MIRALASVAMLAALGGCLGRVFESKSDWERGAIDTEGRVPEQSVSLPPYPSDADLVEFFPGPLRSHRYFIDAKTLSLGADGIARYAVVIRTAGGATNVEYEGIRCRTKEKRTYALGDRDRGWTPTKRSAWEPIQTGRRNEYQAMLHTDYFCISGEIAPDREAILRKLRQGLYEEGNPRTAN